MEPHATTGRVRIPRTWFDTYLRTGAAAWGRPDSVELKFNPWHDPHDGRFTFSGQGSLAGGGGGSFGGGGASGRWAAPSTVPVRRSGLPGQRRSGVSRTYPSATEAAGLSASSPTAQRPSGNAAAVSIAASQEVAHAAARPAPEDRAVTRNGYTYHLDTAGRTTLVSGELSLTPVQKRSRSAQAVAGGSDRLATDDGGHYIAARFSGPTDAFNHFAQDANFNRGGYRVLEDQWARDIKKGMHVFVTITPAYDGRSLRPSSILVRYMLDGRPHARPFFNGAKGISYGK